MSGPGSWFRHHDPGVTLTARVTRRGDRYEASVTRSAAPDERLVAGPVSRATEELAKEAADHLVQGVKPHACACRQWERSEASS